MDNAITYLDKYDSCKNPPDYSYLCSHITRTIHIALAFHHFLYSVTLDNQGEMIFWIAYSTTSNPKTRYDANTTNQIAFTLSYFRRLLCSRLTIGSQIFNLHKILFMYLIYWMKNYKMSFCTNYSLWQFLYFYKKEANLIYVFTGSSLQITAYD